MLQRVFVFPYTVEGELKQVDIPVQDKWVQMRPIVDALGILRSRAMPVLKSYPHEMLTPPERTQPPALYLKTESIDHWLNSLTRYRDKPRLEHFKRHLIVGLNSLIEEREQPQELEQAQEPEAPTVKPMELFQATYRTEAEAREFLGQTHPIYLDTQPLSPCDRMRLFMNQMGVTDFRSLRYAAVVREAAILHRVDDTVSCGFDTLVLRLNDPHIPQHSQLRANGWDVAQVFFLKNPFLYEPDIYYRLQYNRVKGRPEELAAAARAAPWFEPEYAAKVYAARQISLALLDREAEAEAERMRREMEHYLKTGIEPEFLRIRAEEAEKAHHEYDASIDTLAVVAAA